jgi:hypothetical protein
VIHLATRLGTRVFLLSERGEQRDDAVMMSGQFVLGHADFWADLRPVVAPNNQSEQDKKNAKCWAAGDAAAADDYAAMRTPPKARSIVGGGIVGTLFGVATKSNPIGWFAGAAMVLKDNLGGAIVGTIKWEGAYEACAVAP